MRIHNPAITGSLSISGSGLTIDSIGTFSGSATSTGSFGKLFIGNQSLTNLGNQVEFSQNIRLKSGFGLESSLGFNIIQHEVDGSDSGEDIIRIGVDDSPNTDILFMTPGNSEVLLLENAGSARFYGDVRFTKANAKISGSSTSTGSFGQGFFGGNVNIGADGDKFLNVGGTVSKNNNVGSTSHGITIQDATAPALSLWDTTNAGYHSHLFQVEANLTLRSSGNLTLQTNAANAALTIDTSQKVGIGTASPAVQLHLSSSVANNFRLERSGASNAAIHFKNASEDWYAGVTSAANFSISRNADIASGTEFVIRGNTGNIGIGTSNPNAKLEIKGDGATTGLTFKTIESNNNTTFWVQDGGAVGVHYYPFLINHDHDDSRASNTLFHAKGTTGVGLFVKDAGDVGINTTSPGQGQSTPISDVKLDVLGNQMLSDLSSTNTDQAKLFFFRSDGDVASQGVVPDGLKIGAIEWAALTSGDNNNSISSARIEVEASNTWSSAAVRNADIIFSTVGANALTEKLRITSDNKISGSATSTGSFGELKVRGSGVDKISLFGNTTQNINFGDDDPDVGKISYNHNNNVLEFFANNTNILRVMGSGFVTPGTSSTYDIGSSSQLWQNIWLKNGGRVYFGDTGTYIYGSNSLDVLTFAVGANERFKLDVNSRISLSNLDSGLYNTIFGKLAGDDLASGGNGNAFFGENAGHGNTTGDYNVAIGLNAYRFLPAANNNIAIGVDAMASQDNTANGLNDVVAIGFEAFKGTGAGTSAPVGTVAIGSQALTALTTGTGTTAIGYQSLTANTIGIFNTAIGYQALKTNVDGSTNTAVGYLALTTFEADAQDHGENTAVGSKAGTAVSTGTANTLIGKDSGLALTTGDNNTALGTMALSADTDGTDNVAIGWKAGRNVHGAQKNIMIGYKAMANIDNNPGDEIANCVAIGYEAFLGSDNNTTGTTTDANGTIAIGHSSLKALTTGQKNIAIGFEALKTATELDDNLAIGYQALKAASGSAGTGRNMAIGYLAGKSVTSGQFNVLIGRSAGDQQTTADANTYMGYFAGYNTISGSENVFIGRQAGYEFKNANSPYNVYVGSFAGYHNQTGRYNTYIGGQAGFGASGNSHSNNTGVGTNALNDVTTGGDNVAIGSFVAAKLTTGAHNVFIGKTAADDMVEGSYNIAIGSDALGGSKDSTADSSQFNIFMGVNSGNGAWVTAVSQYNVGIGHYTMDAAMNGATNNVAVGHKALSAITTGDANVSLGSEAGESINTGLYNVSIGYQSNEAITSGQYNITIGAFALETATTALKNIMIGGGAGQNITAGVAVNGAIGIGYGAFGGAGTQTTDIDRKSVV